MHRLSVVRFAAALGVAGPQLLGLGAFTAPTAAQSTVPFSAEMLVGRWTDTGDCSDAVDFMADGRFRTTAGAEGTWSLVGSQLTFHGQRSVTARLSAQSRNSITLTHADGSVGGSTRCGATSAARRITMPAVPASAQAALAMGGPINRNYLLGTWTDSGDCSVAIQFLSDGRFVVPTGNGTWTLTSDRLTFTGQTRVTARVRGVGRDRILLIHTDGTVGQSMRC